MKKMIPPQKKTVSSFFLGGLVQSHDRYDLYVKNGYMAVPSCPKTSQDTWFWHVGLVDFGEALEVKSVHLTVGGERMCRDHEITIIWGHLVNLRDFPINSALFGSVI